MPGGIRGTDRDAELREDGFGTVAVVFMVDFLLMFASSTNGIAAGGHRFAKKWPQRLPRVHSLHLHSSWL
jgi:hypothetical protein